MPDPTNEPLLRASPVPSERGPVEVPQGLYGAVEISYVARALGVEDGNPTAATDALRELARGCTIRFGVQPAAVERVAQALSLSVDQVRSTNTIETSGVANDEWRRLQSKMRFPSDEPLLGAHVEVFSSNDLQQLVGEISKLREESAELSPLDRDLARHVVTALPRLREMLRAEDLEPELREFVGNCARQIALAERLGVEWTMVSPRERAFMQRLLSEGLLTPPDPTQDAELANRLLEPLGMGVEYVAERGRLEPFLKKTLFSNTSLFQRSSRYFSILIDEARQPKSHATRFFKDLCAARERYEQGGKRDEATLRAAESRAFQALLKKLSQ